jgi:hypothetical protein
MNNDEAKARAEALLFRPTSPESRSAAMLAYRAEKQAALDNMARLRAARLAREGEAAASQPKTPRRNRRRISQAKTRVWES